MRKRRWLVVAAVLAVVASALVLLNSWADRLLEREAELEARERGLPRQAPWQPRPATPISEAAAGGDLDALRASLAAGAAPNTVEGAGWTPLMWAARYGQDGAIQVLAAHGAGLERRDRRNGWTPLLHAVHKDQPAAVRALIAAGADVNARADSGATALILAAGEGQLEIVEALLAAGADPYARASGGVNALISAELSGNPRVPPALLAAAPDLPQRTGRRQLWMARAAGWVLSFAPRGERRDAKTGGAEAKP